MVQRGKFLRIGYVENKKNHLGTVNLIYGEHGRKWDVYEKCCGKKGVYEKLMGRVSRRKKMIKAAGGQ